MNLHRLALEELESRFAPSAGFGGGPASPPASLLPPADEDVTAGAPVHTPQSVHAELTGMPSGAAVHRQAALRSPVIFAHDFESADFAAWDAWKQAPGASLQIDTDVAAQGNVALRLAYHGIAAPECWLRKDFDQELADFFLRFDFRVADNLHLGRDDEISLVNLLQHSIEHDVAAASMILKQSADDQLELYWVAMDDRDQFSYVRNADPIGRNKWHAIELRYQSADTNGGIEFWMDGRYQGRSLGRADPSRVVTSLYVGSLIVNSVKRPSGDLFFDDLVVASERIGASAPFIPKLGISESALTFTATVGQFDPTPQDFAVFNLGGDVLSWAAFHDIPWLSLSSTGGVVQDADHSITASVDIGDLSTGTYTGVIRVSNRADPQDAQAIAVTLTVNPYGSVLFADDFEDEGFPRWTGQGKDRDVVVLRSNEHAYQDDHSLRLSFMPPAAGKAYLYRSLDSRATTHLSLSLYLDQAFDIMEPGRAVNIAGLGRRLGQSDIATVTMALEKFEDDALYLYWTYYYGDNLWDSLKPIRLERQRWYRVELAYVAGTTNGSIQYWLDGRYRGGVRGRDTSHYGVDAVYLGPFDLSSSTVVAGDLYFDAIVVGDNFIGDPAEPFISKVATSERAVSFAATRGRRDPPPEALSIYNRGGALLHWIATSTQPWLAIAPASGTSAGLPKEAEISVRIDNLPAGDHSGQIVIRNTDHPEDVATIPVSLQINNRGTILIRDDFETDDGPDWKGSENDPHISIQSSGTTAFTGSRSLKIAYAAGAADTAYLYKTLGPSLEEIHATFALYIGSDFSLGAPSSAVDVAGLFYQDDRTLRPALNLAIEEYLDGKLYLYWSYYHAEVFRDTLDARQIDRERWYRIEVRYVAGRHGCVEYWVDGLYQDGIRGPDTSRYRVNTVYLGSVEMDPSAGPEGEIHLDTFAIADTRIGDVDRPFVPQVATSQASLSFTATVGGTEPPGQELLVYNAGGGAGLAWTATSDQTWLRPRVASGTVTADANELPVSVELGALGVGTHTGKIRITHADGLGQPVIIPVTVSINEYGTLYFSEDFETGDLSRWDSTNRGSRVSLSVRPSGMPGSRHRLVISHSDATDVGSYLKTQLSAAYNEFSLRFRLTLSDDYSISEVDKVNHVVSVGYANPLRYVPAATMAIERSLSNEMLLDWFYFTNRQVRNGNLLEPFVLERNRTYCIEMRYKADPLQGGMEYWVDGQLRGWYWGHDTSGNSMNTLILGSLSVDSGATVEGDISMDDVAVSDRRIGCGTPNRPHVATSRRSLAFGVTAGGRNPGKQTIDVFNLGGGQLKWSATGDVNWLRIEPPEGIVTSANKSVVIDVDATSLPVGRYEGTLTFKNAADPLDQRDVLVALEVNANGTRYFDEEFETGVANWKVINTPFRLPDSGSGVNVSATVERSHQGTHSLRIDYLGEGTKRQYLRRAMHDRYEELFLKFALYLDKDFTISAAGTTVNLVALGDEELLGSSVVAWLALDKSEGGAYQLRWGYRDDDDRTRMVRPYLLSRGKWHLVELRFISDPVAGGIEYWVDGIYQGGDTVLSTVEHRVNTISIGSLGVDDNGHVENSIYLDSVAVSDRRLGLSRPFTPDLETTVKALTLVGEKGRPEPTDSRVGIYNLGGGILDFEVSDDAAWLKVTPASGQVRRETEYVQVSADTTFLSPGRYRAEITFTNPAMPVDAVVVRVTLLLVQEDHQRPKIKATPNHMHFRSEVDGMSPANQIVSIRNAGGRPLRWTGTPDVAWLSINPASGTLAPGEEAEITTSVDATDLFMGLHAGGIVWRNADDPLDVEKTETTFSTGLFESFDADVAGSWTFDGDGTAASVSRVDDPTRQGNTALRVDYRGVGSKNVFLVRELDAAYEESTLSVSVYLDADFTMPSGSNMEIASLRNRPEMVEDRSAALLVARGNTGLRLFVQYSAAGGQRGVLGPYPVERGQWYRVDVRYCADEFNGGAAFWVDGILRDAAWNFNTVGYDIQAISIGSRDGNAEPGARGHLLIDDVAVNKTHLGLGTTRRSLRFETTAHQQATARQTLRLYTTGPTPVNWTASADQPWIVIDRMSGSLSHTPQELAVSVDSAALEPGSYRGTIVVSDAEDPSDSETVVIALTVNEKGTFYLVEDFEQASLPGWEFANRTTDVAVSTTDTIQSSGERSLVARYRGATDGGAYLWQHLPRLHEDLYIRLDVRLGDDYFQAEVEKNNNLFALLRQDNRDSILLATASVCRLEDGRYQLSLGFFNGPEAIYSRPTVMERSTWYSLEVHLLSNDRTAGLEYWVNGEYRDSLIGPTRLPARGANVVAVGALGADSGAIVDGAIYVDDLMLADRRIGTTAPFTPAIAVGQRDVLLEATAAAEERPYADLRIYNIGGGSLRWQAVSDVSWLVLDPPQGRVTAETMIVRLGVETGGMSAGTYSATITVTNLDEPNDVQQVQLILVVNPRGTSYFREDFETGGFRNWLPAATGKDVTLSVSSSVVAEGSGAARVDYGNGADNEAYYRKHFDTDFPSVYLRFYVYFDENYDLATPWQSNYLVSLGYDRDNIFESAATFTIEKFSNLDPDVQEDVNELVFYWTFFYEDGQWSYLRPYNIELGQWYSVEIRYVSSKNGIVEYWVNGEYQDGAKGQDTSAFGVNTLYLGSISADPDAAPSGAVYFDDILLGDGHIGAETPYVPKIAVSEPFLVFEAALGGSNPDPQELRVVNRGGGTLSWKASTDEQWLTLSESAGQVEGPSSIIEVSADTTGLTSGTHVGTITIANADDPKDLETVEVYVRVSQDGLYYLSETFESDSLEDWVHYGSVPELSLDSGGVAVEGRTALKATYLTGEAGDAHIRQKLQHTHEDVYIRLFLRLADDYSISQQRIAHRMLRLGHDDQYALIPAIDLGVELDGKNAYRLVLELHDRDRTNFLRPYPIEKELWYCVEMHYLTDDADGGLEYWVNGQYGGAVLGQDTSAAMLNTLILGSLGTDQDGRVEGSVFFDNLAVADRRIGCGMPFVSMLSTNERSIAFEAAADGDKPRPKIIEVFNVGGGDLRWSVSTNHDWLEVTPRTGENFGPSNQLTVAPSMDSLTEGTHHGTMRLNNLDNPQDWIEIDVTVNIRPDGLAFVSESFEGEVLAGWAEHDDGSTVSLRITKERAAEGEASLQLAASGRAVDHYLYQTVDSPIRDANLRFQLQLGDHYSIAESGSAHRIMRLGYWGHFNFAPTVDIVVESTEHDEYALVLEFINGGRIQSLYPFAVDKGQWYSVEVRFISDAVDGGVQYWVDGQYQDGMLGQDTRSSSINTIAIGSLGTEEGVMVEGSAYFDDIVLADRHVGTGVPFIPKVGTTTRSLVFQSTKGRANPKPRSLGIYNRGGGVLHWTAVEQWEPVSLNVSSGAVTGQTAEIEVSVDAQGLSAGIYRGHLAVMNADDPSDQQTVAVEIIVHGSRTVYFSDDFEQGDLDPWSEVQQSGDGLRIGTEQFDPRNHVLAVSNANTENSGDAYVRDRLDALAAEVFLDLSFYIADSFSISDAHEASSIVALAHKDAFLFQSVLTVSIERNAADDYFLQIQTLANDTQLIYFQPYLLSKDQWYSLGIRYVSAQDDGGIEYWINDVRQSGIWSQNTSYPGINTLVLGLLGTPGNTVVTGNIYFDDVVVSDGPGTSSATAQPLVAYSSSLPVAGVHRLNAVSGGSSPP